MNLGENIVTIVVIIALTAMVTTCNVSQSWEKIETQKIQLERDKLGLK